MKNAALAISLILISLQSFGQLDSLSKNVLEILLRKQHPNGTIYYTDKLGSNELTAIRKAVKKRSYFTSHRPANNDTIFLSRAEAKFIESEIKKWKSLTWKDSLFKSSKRIPVDSMFWRVEKKSKEFFDSYFKDSSKTAKTWSVDALVELTNTFQFSPPVFLRNKTIFLAYIFRLCGGLCGEYELTFYKLKNGIYKKWILVMGGVF